MKDADMSSDHNDTASRLPWASWVSVGDVAQLLGRSPRQIRNWINAGQIRGQRDNQGMWFVHPDDIHIPERRRRGSGPGGVVVRTQPVDDGPMDPLGTAPWPLVPSVPLVPPVPVGADGGAEHGAGRGAGSDDALMAGLELALLRTELEHTRTELVAVRAELGATAALLTERTTQLRAARAALRSMVSEASDPQ